MKKQSKTKKTKAQEQPTNKHKQLVKPKVKQPEKPTEKWFHTKAFRVKVIKNLIFFVPLISLLLWLFWGLPLPSKLGEDQVPVSTKLFDRNGKLIYEIYADKKSTPVNIQDLPPYIVQATLAIEDKDFYKHHGISLMGIGRAAYNTLFKGKLQGGSTLTQQLVKNSLLTSERTIKRKIREYVLTQIVETFYTKDQILSMYLNQIPYGSTAYGVGAASELYFNKPARDLSLAEATLLAGLPAAPSKFSPYGAYPELAKERQAAVLRRMVEDKHLSQEDADKAANEDLQFAQPEKLKAPHFALWVKQLLAEEYGEAVTEKGGLRVKTTLDLDLQEKAEEAVLAEVTKLKKSNVGNGAAIVTRPKTGEVLAMVGSKDYFATDEDGKVNIIFRERQPGSSIKPLNYALALRDKKITPATPLADVPTCFSSFGQIAYCPKNYDGSFHGAVHTRFALGNSYNIPAVRILALNGLENFIDFAKQMGITTFRDPSNYGLSLTLGGGEVRPADMAVAFGVFANQGVKQPLVSILKVEDWKGKVLQEVNPAESELAGERVLGTDVTFLISHMLQDNNARSAAFGTGSLLNVKGHPEVSVKTGTTNDLKDNWTIGYTQQALVVAWVGNNDNAPMSNTVSGVSGASPIWNAVMEEVLNRAEEGQYAESDKGHAWPKKPQEVVGASVCVTSGNLPSDADAGCPTRFEYFLKDKVGAQVESGRKDLVMDKTTQSIAQPDVAPENTEVQNHAFLNDPLGTLICLDCFLPKWQLRIGYPLVQNKNDNQ